MARSRASLIAKPPGEPVPTSMCKRELSIEVIFLDFFSNSVSCIFCAFFTRFNLLQIL